MIGKIIVFTLGAAAGIIGTTVYDDSKALCSSCSETFEAGAVVKGLKTGWDKFREGFKEGYQGERERHASQ